MRRSTRRRGPVFSLLAAITLASVASLSPVPAASAQEDDSRTYFLALGDSLPYGDQAGAERFKGDMSGEPVLQHGFVEHMEQQLQGRFPDLVVHNLACSGETTWGMRHSTATIPELVEGRPAGCKPPEDYEAHYPHPGHSQLSEAVALLNKYGGAVKLVTVTAGYNDVHDWCPSGSAGPCQRGPVNVLDQVREEMTAILAELNLARRPGTRVVGTLYYNPYVGPADQQRHRLVEELNAVLREVYTAAGVRIADAGVAIPAEKVCERTTWCSWRDPHPNDAGYRAIGDELLRAADWDRPTRSASGP